MRRLTMLLALLLIALLSLTGVAGAESPGGVVDVEVTNFTYTPINVQITAGETVSWTNMQGFHNVVADDGSFDSGPAANPPWNFQHTFNTPGSYPYYCSIHGAPGGIGMSGTVTVEPTNPLVRSVAIILVPRPIGTFHLIIGLVVVRDDAGAPVPGATVSANWTLPNGTVQNRTAVSNASGLAPFFTFDGLGTYTLEITNIAAAGFTFDPGGSVLTRSITIP